MSCQYDRHTREIAINDSDAALGLAGGAFLCLVLALLLFFLVDATWPWLACAALTVALAVAWFRASLAGDAVFGLAARRLKARGGQVSFDAIDASRLVLQEAGKQVLLRVVHPDLPLTLFDVPVKERETASRIRDLLLSMLEDPDRITQASAGSAQKTHVLSPAQRWILGAGAILAQCNGFALDRLGTGALGFRLIDRQKAKLLLDREWHCNGREDLVATISWLVAEGGHSEQFGASRRMAALPAERKEHYLALLKIVAHLHARGGKYPDIDFVATYSPLVVRSLTRGLVRSRHGEDAVAVLAALWDTEEQFEAEDRPCIRAIRQLVAQGLRAAGTVDGAFREEVAHAAANLYGSRGQPLLERYRFRFPAELGSARNERALFADVVALEGLRDAPETIAAEIVRLQRETPAPHRHGAEAEIELLRAIGHLVSDGRLFPDLDAFGLCAGVMLPSLVERLIELRCGAEGAAVFAAIQGIDQELAGAEGGPHPESLHLDVATHLRTVPGEHPLPDWEVVAAAQRARNPQVADEALARYRALFERHILVIDGGARCFADVVMFHRALLGDPDHAEEEISRVRLLDEDRSEQQVAARYMVWDHARALLLYRLGHMVGWFDEPYCWEHMLPLAENIQKHYRSWTDMAEAYLEARLLWNGAAEDAGMQANRQAVNEITADPDSPWNTLDWQLSLHADWTYVVPPVDVPPQGIHESVSS